MGGDVLMAAQAAGNAAEHNGLGLVFLAAEVLWEIYALTHEEEIAMFKDKICAYIAEKMGCSQSLVEETYDGIVMGLSLTRPAKKPVKKIVETLLGKGLKSSIRPHSIKDKTTTSSTDSTLPNPSTDQWSRKPKSLQDQMTLDAAKRGEGEVAMPPEKLRDPRYKGMVKMRCTSRSNNGKVSAVHYMKDLKTGELMDFKFKKHSTD